MAADSKELKEKLELSESQLSYMRRVLIRALLQTGDHSYTSDEITIIREVPMHSAELTNGFLDVLKLLETKIYKVRKTLDSKEVEMIKSFQAKIAGKAEWSNIYIFLQNVVTINDFHPKNGTPLQIKAYKILRVFSLRRFDSNVEYDIREYMVKFNIHRNTSDRYPFQRELFEAMDNVMTPICKILAGKSLTEAEIKALSECAKPLHYLDCCSDAEVAAVSKSFQEFCAMLKQPKPVLLSAQPKQAQDKNTPPGGLALDFEEDNGNLAQKAAKPENDMAAMLAQYPDAAPAAPAEEIPALPRPELLQNMSFETQLAMAMEVSKREAEKAKKAKI